MWKIFIWKIKNNFLYLIKMEYSIKITYIESGKIEVITLHTDDLNWSMEQYQRNRKTFKWELLTQ